MDQFKAILPQVRALLSSAWPAQVQGFLDGLLEKDLLSKEYHQALLREPDREALARKVSLSLLEKWDLCIGTLIQCVRHSGHKLQSPGMDGISSRSQATDQCAAMESGPLAEGSYLGLLQSDINPLQLFHFYDQHLAAEEEIEYSSDPDTDTINCDQVNRLWNAIEDEGTGEAYDRIAALAEYMFSDRHLEAEGIFGNIGPDEVVNENTDALTEIPQKSQKCQKRLFLDNPEPQSDSWEAKRRKPEASPDTPLVTSNLMTVSSSNNLALKGSLSPLPGQVAKPSLLSMEETFLVPTSPVLACLNFNGEPIQLIPTFPTLPQGVFHFTVENGISNIFLYPASSGGDTIIQSLPVSPDRHGSTSPFTPSAADMPNMPEASALTSQDRKTESVERFCRALQKAYEDVPEGPNSHYIDLDLTRTQVEKNNKNQEKELAIQDWTERQKARVGWREVFASTRGQKRETRVIAVLGKAGLGKSAWTQQVCRNWAQGQLPQYEFVFHYKCRSLNLPGNDYCLKDLFFRLYNHPLEASEEVFKYILKHPNRILVILDSFEELEGQDGFLNCPASPSPGESRPIKGLLAGLFQRKLLRGCTLLITARPKGRFIQYLAKVDSLLEVQGFSPEQVESYFEKYFQGSPSDRDEALRLVRAQPYLLSHCYSPAVCLSLCRLCEKILATKGPAQLPSTLTGLFVSLLCSVLRARERGPSETWPRNCLAGLTKLAWELGQRHCNVLREDQLPSTEVKEFAILEDFVSPFPTAREPEMAFLLQNFLGALRLALSEEVRDKELPRYLALTPRKKKPYDNWLERVPPFLTGLLFQPLSSCLGPLGGNEQVGLICKRQKALLNYLTRLQPGTLGPGRLLELLHCAHEATDSHLWQHVTAGLPSCLSFRGVRLAPPDVHVLGEALKAAGKHFSLDLRNTSIDLHGLGILVQLGCVTCFRASLSDTVWLWESLRQSGEYELFRSSTEKFTIDPFKVKSMKDVEDLCSLVNIQGSGNAAREACDPLPAIRDLKNLEFALDTLHGNKIGDEGVAQLSAIFPELKALETLNLSQNSITDVGAMELAKALPTLATSLVTLSLYNNCICDTGAENLASVLPNMVSLRVLDVKYNKFTRAGAQQLTASLKKCPHIETLAMWNPTIPYGVQEHLQQLDSRISLR
ncbi:MHC class II transactivator isoform X3 [Phascolarctos cinereus]|uniref:MHC class II transactivator isoform X3 n=1 Tax=Phascolarctos cinereus TaxID=38626 RepID=A0A6P5JAN0_PHACI|nr:MHC class II transactivator isoform X3 [Phascolarctos cinereus]